MTAEHNRVELVHRGSHSKVTDIAARIYRLQEQVSANTSRHIVSQTAVRDQLDMDHISRDAGSSTLQTDGQARSDCVRVMHECDHRMSTCDDDVPVNHMNL